MMMTNAFIDQPQRGIFEYFREHPQMAIPEKFWVWPLIHCYEFRPFQTNLRGVDQISQFQANFTISAKFHNPGIPIILRIPGVKEVSQFLRCLLLILNRVVQWNTYIPFGAALLGVLCFPFQQNEIGAAAFGTLSLINHSCDPNVVRHYHSSHAVVRTIRYQVSFALIVTIMLLLQDTSTWRWTAGQLRIPLCSDA